VSHRKDKVDTVAIRHLDEIHETEPTARPSRLSALVMASFGGACIVFTALALMRSPAKQAPVPVDPLGDLVAKAHPAGQTGKPETLGAADVTFPEVLSDRENPTTALAAVRTAAARSRSESSPPAGAAAGEGELPHLPVGPPPATDRLSVMPLPANDVLQGSQSRVAPADTLRQLADQASRERPAADMAPSGGPGGYQLQVSSFQSEQEANGFAEALRRRGHRAYVQSAYVRGRGVWYRVRIGPFKYRRSAEIYRQDFEAKERLVTFVIDPPKTTVEIGLAKGED
jgi:cell division septation protein DedD